MCGIAGFWSDRATPDADALVRRMTDAIAHRGPDADGFFVAPEGGPALGHRRLSILDLSPCGAQPMTSASGRYVVVFNGEIYNWRRLRDELARDGATFRGHSDTEVLLCAVERWGVVEAVRRCAGMFALALWDARDGELHLVRDRLGEKPLYYGWVGDTLLFGSELKAMRAHPAWRGEVDRGVLSLYVRHSYVPGPYSIYTGIGKVEPGTIVTYRRGAPGAPGAQREPRVTRYWSAREAAERGMAHPLAGGETETVDRFAEVLGEVVGEQMVADVPLGAFLSGGIDSSTIVALMQARSAQPIRTFTIGFDDEHYDEARHARAVAAHLGTAHTELYVTPQDTLGVIPRLPTLYDEPFADSSQIPTFLVSQLTRQHVTVSLSGDGGDELFGGYNRYVWGERLWGMLGRVPRPMRAAAARSIRSVSPDRWNRLARAAGAPARRLGVGGAPGDRLHKLAGVLAVESPRALYHELVSTWAGTERIVLGGGEPPTKLSAPNAALSDGAFIPHMMYLDLVTYLPDDILVKVDRAAMGVSLETRAPFLDHRVAEFAWRVPMQHKMRDGKGKWLVRQLLYRHVPPALVDRPKMGFAVPIETWLRGPLRPWAEELLSEERLRRDGFFAPEVIRRRWSEHLSGARNWHAALWAVLMFQAWHDAQ